LSWARADADSYVFAVKTNPATAAMVKRVRSDPRYGLANVG
jgi:hypothetical protein